MIARDNLESLDFTICKFSFICPWYTFLGTFCLPGVFMCIWENLVIISCLCPKIHRCAKFHFSGPSRFWDGFTCLLIQWVRVIKKKKIHTIFMLSCFLTLFTIHKVIFYAFSFSMCRIKGHSVKWFQSKTIPIQIFKLVHIWKNSLPTFKKRIFKKYSLNEFLKIHHVPITIIIYK